jgi:Rho GTPase-activating protein RGD1
VPGKGAPSQLLEDDAQYSNYGKGAPPQLPEVETQFSRAEINQDVQRAVPGSSNGSQPVLPLNLPHSPTPPSHIAHHSSTTPVTYPSSNRGSGPPSSNLPTSSAQPSAAYTSNQPAPQIPSYSDPPNLSSSNLMNQHEPMSSIQPTPTSVFIPPVSYPSSTPPIADSSSPPTQYDRPSTSGQQSYPTGSVQPYKPLTPKGHTFGVPLDEVLARESATLPLIIARCVIAIDQFGMKTEGIYRVSGGATTVAKLKHLFDFEPDRVDFRTSAGFFGDIHAVAGILKQYLRELPEPILTRMYYNDFIEVARKSIGYNSLIVAIEPAFHRRDAVHSLINDLPDANYSCIRTLALHLHKFEPVVSFLTLELRRMRNLIE